MTVWVLILFFTVGATAFIIILATLSNLIVAWFARRHADKTLDKSLTDLERLLPGKNCGECGCKTCTEYAQAVFTYRMDTDRCKEGSEDLPQKLNIYMEQFQNSLENDTPKENDRWFR